MFKVRLDGDLVFFKCLGNDMGGKGGTWRKRN